MNLIYKDSAYECDVLLKIAGRQAVTCSSKRRSHILNRAFMFLERSVGRHEVGLIKTLWASQFGNSKRREYFAFRDYMLGMSSIEVSRKHEIRDVAYLERLIRKILRFVTSQYRTKQKSEVREVLGELKTSIRNEQKNIDKAKRRITILERQKERVLTCQI